MARESFELLTFEEFSQIAGGEILQRGSTTAFSSVVIDSRNAGEGAVFFALPGAATDGHRFAAAALRQGAAGIVVRKDSILDEHRAAAAAADTWLIAVDNTLEALHKAAAAYLDRYPALLRVGITGSTGKTTVKEIAAAMFAAEHRVIYNAGNLNSETGLPLSVFTVRPEHEVGIFEAGMDHHGEIAALAAVLRPHIALITNIGPAHIGTIGSIEGILYEKQQIYNHLTKKPDGTPPVALIPADSPYRDALAESVPAGVKTVFYGPESLEAIGGIIDKGIDGAEIIVEGISARFNLPGAHMARNAVAAAALAAEAGISGAAIRHGIEAVRPLYGRSQILKAESRGREFTYIRDCYNSNPASAAAAVDFADSLELHGRRRVYCFGSMLDLGAEAAAAHYALAERLAESKASDVLLYGPEFGSNLPRFRGLDTVFTTNEMEFLALRLDEVLVPGCLLLVKGSRGCKMEALEELLEVHIHAV
jgi:UDP-N-acetylmuramoyl-tripeptide--D-alanyl-D-alanine ligase